MYTTVLLIALPILSAIITAVILNRDGNAFELFLHALGAFAAYRCFSSIQADDVGEGLAECQGALERAFRMLDFWRGYDNGSAHDRIKKAQRDIKKCQRAMDYAIAVAYLAGFGKIARKFAK